METLEKVVLEVINLHIDLLIDTEKIVKQINNSSVQNNKSKNIENIIITKKNEITKISNFKRTLYEDWKKEDITRDEYLEYKRRYEKDIERLKKNIENLEIEKSKYKIQNITNNKWLERIKKQGKITSLTRNIMIELIDSIYVKENGDFIIKFKFKDEFQRCLENKI